MRYLRLGWVICRRIMFCDDSPFAYIIFGAGFLAATIACGGAGGKERRYSHIHAGT